LPGRSPKPDAGIRNPATPNASSLAAIGGVLLKIDAGLTGVARFLSGGIPWGRFLVAIMSEQGSDWRVDRAVLNNMGT